MIYLLIQFFILVPLASESSVWFTDSDVSEKSAEIKRKPNFIQKRVRRKTTALIKGNLPDYAIYKGEFGRGEIQGPLSINSENSYYIMRSVKAGDQFKLSLDNIIYAIEDQKIAVTGTILSGELMGFNVVGYTRLEPYSKKILIDFTTLVDEKGSEYLIKAYGLRHGDQFFSPTKYISKKSKFLFGRVLSAFGASFLESKIRVNQTLLGQTQGNDVKSSGYSAGREGMEVVSNDFRDALNNSKDVALVAQKMMYEIKFLNSPKTK